uniref:AARP2CN domain-containing protein n=1 Tax=Heterorhabditis bacteriophora TaxID=37862 RepID=A0A1I7XQ29_HETBA
MSTGHQPGIFKKPAKPHKTFKGKRSKGQVDADNRGRLGVRDITKSHCRSLSKDERRVQASHIRSNKRKLALERKRALGIAGAPPILSTILAFGSSGSSLELISRLSQCDETIFRTDGHNVAYFSVPRFKSRIGFLTPQATVIDDVLNCLKVRYYLIFSKICNFERYLLQDGICTLMASGYVRGPAWNVNRLVHIQGWGDFRVSSIEAEPDPHPLKQAHNQSDRRTVLTVASVDKQESLLSEEKC